MKDYYKPWDNPLDLDSAIIDLRNYRKIRSILYLIALKQPTLKGIIITKWDETVYRVVMNFCAENNWDKLLLRHDKSIETPPYPMGGYLVNLDKIQDEVLRYLAMGRILLMLEPASPYDNSYNVNILFEGTHKAMFEIVGPGFDASDLQRGQITPHEIIQFNQGHAENTRKVDAVEYQLSVKQRYIKIAKRLMDLGEIESKEKELDEIKLVTLARNYLQAHGHNMLLLHEGGYTPIPWDYLTEIWSYTSKLPIEIEQFVHDVFPFVVSSSYINNGQKLVFWDIVWPLLKYEGRLIPKPRQLREGD